MPDDKILDDQPTLRKNLERFLPEGRSLGDLPTELVDELQGVQFTPREIISDRFEVIEQLGFGGMGAVYKVKDLLMRGQLKALKVMLPSLVRNRETRERFISEAEIAQSLRHEGIATVYDIGKHKDFLFLTMELLEGTSLDRYLKSRGGRVDFPEAVGLVLKICEGLSYAHKKGVIHRDIKPQNIFVLPDGRVKLLDFGLAKLLSPGRLTRSSIGLGTAYYMSPEQSMGREVDERSDIFSLGVVFYQALIGRIPMGRFKLPSTLNPSIPSSIDSIVEKCLDEQPEERYLKVESLVADIEQVRSTYEKEEKEKIEREQKALAERKRKIDSLLRKGKSAFERNSFDEAISIFDEILRIDSEHKEARELLDRVTVEKGRFEELQKREEERRKAEELRRREEERLRREAEETEKRKKAEERRTKQEEERRHKIESLLEEGKAFLIGNKFTWAIEAFEKVLRLDSTNKDALDLLEEGKSGKKRVEELERREEEERRKAERIKREEEERFRKEAEEQKRREGERKREEERKKREAEEAERRRREEEDAKRKKRNTALWSGLAVIGAILLIIYFGYRKSETPQVSPPPPKEERKQVSPSAPSPALPKSVPPPAMKETKPSEAPALAPKEEPSAHPKPGSVYKDPSTGMEFVFVKGGSYQMGDNFGDGYEGEKPVHEVYVDSFWMGKFEVPQGQWEQVMGGNPSNFKSGVNYPVDCVKWDGAQEFIRRLNERTGKGYRLPTEAEWEYAARSGGKEEKWAGTSSEGNLGEYAWYEKNSTRQTSPVGQKRPNGIGLFDMSGNVWEWCEDWYDKDYYSRRVRDNPKGPDSGRLRVVRGGSWPYDPRNVRASNRNGGEPWLPQNNYGFRLVLSSK